MEKKNVTNSLDKIIGYYKEIKRLRGLVEDKKQELNSRDSVKRYTTESRQEELDTFVSDCRTKEKTIREKMKQEVKNIEAEVCQGFEYNPELIQEIDFLATMARAGAISANMILATANKYKGSEPTLLYLKQKLKDAGLDASPIDNLLFSGSDTDLSGNSYFVPPTKYFNSLSADIQSGLDGIALIHNLEMISNKTGAESTSLQNLKTEIKENLDKSMNNMLPVF